MAGMAGLTWTISSSPSRHELKRLLHMPHLASRSISGKLQQLHRDTAWRSFAILRHGDGTRSKSESVGKREKCIESVKICEDLML